MEELYITNEAIAQKIKELWPVDEPFVESKYKIMCGQFMGEWVRDQYEKRVKELEDECFSLAAGLCHDGYGDEWGNFRCKYQDTIYEKNQELKRWATQILKVRDQIVKQDQEEAWHELYRLADPNFEKSEPWEELEIIAKS